MGQVQNEINNVDFKEVKSQSEKVRKVIKDTFNPNDISGIKISGLDDAIKSTTTLTAEQAKLKAEMNEVGRKMLDLNADSEEYSKLMNRMHQVNSQLNGKPSSSPITVPEVTNNNNQSMTLDESNISFLDKIKEKIDQAKVYVQQFKSQFNFEPLRQQLLQFGNIKNLFNAESSSKELDLINYKISEIEEKLQIPSKFNMNTGDIVKAEADLEKLKNKKEQIENSGKGNFFSNLINSCKGASSQLSKMQGITIKIKNSINQMSTGFKSGLGTVLKYAGALFGLRSIYQILKSSASSWLSSQNAGAQKLSANIEYMKYAMGSVFAPVIETVINLVYKLMKAIQSVAYALTGVNIFAKATASSMNKTSKSASKTSKSLAGIHSEISNVSKDKDSSGGSTAPSIDLSKLENPSSNILEAIKNGNWLEVGSMIGEKLNSALTSIPWDKIKSTAKNIGTNIANFLNGFIESTDWNLVGNTIAQGLNTSLNFVNGFLNTFDFSTFGFSISTGIMGFIENVEWETLATNFSLGLQGLFNGITGFIKGWNWKIVVDAIVEFIKGIKFSNISDALFEMLGSAVASLVNLGKVIGDYINDGIDIASEYFADKVEECGGNIVLGILKGIVDFFVNIGIWIGDHIFKPFINGFKNVFGIHSPSTVMEEQGHYIIEGLLNGISNLVFKIGEIWINIKNMMRNGAQNAYNAVKNVFSSLASFFKNIFSNAWNAVKNVFSKGGQVFFGIKEGILSTFKTIVNGLIDGINKVVSIPFKAINTALSKIKGIEIANFKPFSWISTISIPQIPKLATGTVAYKETLGIFGEYSNAKNNPEIVSPKNIMQETFRDELQNYVNNNNTKTGLEKLIIQFGSTQVALEIEQLIRQARRQNGTANVTI